MLTLSLLILFALMLSTCADYAQPYAPLDSGAGVYAGQVEENEGVGMR